MTATRKHIPGKRIKTLYRAARKEGVTNSLRSFAHALAGSNLPGNDTAKMWLAGKRKPQTMKPQHRAVAS